MEICNVVRNLTIPNTSFTWGQVLNETVNYRITVAYLRPSKGITLIPWPFVLIWLLLHIPTVIIRVVRWETIQVWCLVSALFSIVIYVQAYISTRFGPDKVLIWNPLVLIIHAGSMLQVFVLVVEDSERLTRLLDRIRVDVRRYRMRPETGGKDHYNPWLVD
jgi:hypothetical protein